MLSEFKPSEVVSLLAMSLVAEGKPERIEFRTEDLCRISGLTRMTFQKNLHDLAKRGVLRILECKSGASGTTVVSIPKAWITVAED
jgi:hypothetical protein